jgi:hypothetical protein
MSSTCEVQFLAVNRHSSFWDWLGWEKAGTADNIKMDTDNMSAILFIVSSFALEDKCVDIKTAEILLSMSGMHILHIRDIDVNIVLLT